MARVIRQRPASPGSPVKIVPSLSANSILPATFLIPERQGRGIFIECVAQWLPKLCRSDGGSSLQSNRG
jgi:hypothetical protein